MRLKNFILMGMKKLENISNTPRLDVEVLVKDVLKWEKGLLDEHYILLDDELNMCNELLDRRVKGEPIAYILRNKEFWSIDFEVDKGVLIPRGDTEIGVEYIINHVNKTNTKVNICEFGVGSGCIIISILSECKNAYGIGYEKSVKAYRVAKNNIYKYGLQNKVKLYNCSWEFCREKVDIIVSNPPYIRFREMMQLMKDVRDYEPRCALYGGATGGDCFRSIFKTAKNVLNSRGIIIFEVGYGQDKLVKNIGIENGFVMVDQKKDLGNIIRYMVFKFRGVI